LPKGPFSPFPSPCRIVYDRRRCEPSTVGSWAYGKEKIRGAERNLPDFFGLCPRCQKKFSGETFQNCGGRSHYEKFLLDSIFPKKLTEFPTKLTEFVPFIFIISQYCPTVKRILPDLALFAQQTGTPMRRLELARVVLKFGSLK
jgi:hypothetical protein